MVARVDGEAVELELPAARGDLCVDNRFDVAVGDDRPAVELSRQAGRGSLSNS